MPGMKISAPGNISGDEYVTRPVHVVAGHASGIVLALEKHTSRMSKMELLLREPSFVRYSLASTRVMNRVLSVFFLALYNLPGFGMLPAPGHR